jgi:hypothetical protein
VKRKVERLTGWLALVGCVSIAISILMTPSWEALLAGGLLIVAFALISRSLLKTRPG